MNEVTRLLKEQTESKNVTIDVAIEEGSAGPLRVCADRARLQQVLYNSLKYSLDAVAAEDNSLQITIQVRQADEDAEPPERQGSVKILVQDLRSVDNLEGLRHFNNLM